MTNYSRKAKTTGILSSMTEKENTSTTLMTKKKILFLSVRYIVNVTDL